MELLPSRSPQEFARCLAGELGGRAWLVREAESGRFLASSPRLAALADWLASETEPHGHEAVFLEVGRGSGALFGAVIHRTERGQAQGGVRRQDYPSVADFLRDGLRLSLAMTRKNALAQLWWGGGKGLIAGARDALVSDPDGRRRLYQEYGAFVSGLRGCYVTAEDAGTRPADLAEVFKRTRFTTCVPAECGGSGNPSAMTAEGVALAMEASLDSLRLGSLRGRKVVVQGGGQVGAALVDILLERGVREIVVGEVCPERCDALCDAFAALPVEIRCVAADDASLLWEPCDVLAPCALGGVLGPKTIPGVQARMVCGSANSPLVDELRDAAHLAERGILYLPDFVANRMGIVSCANEQYGFLRDDPAVLRHLDPDWTGSIPRTARCVIEESYARGTTPLAEALALADALAGEIHPLWGNRGRRIIEALCADGWMSGHAGGTLPSAR